MGKDRGLSVWDSSFPCVCRVCRVQGVGSVPLVPGVFQVLVELVLLVHEVSNRVLLKHIPLLPRDHSFLLRNTSHCLGHNFC